VEKSAWRFLLRRPQHQRRDAGRRVQFRLNNDLELSGVIELVSPSFYPLQAPTRLEELKPEAWTAAPTNAHMVAFGNLQFSGDQLLIEAWLSDVRNPQAAPVLAKRYRGDLTEDSARALAHQFADEIIERLSGGLPGIARSQIALVSDRSGSKEIWVMDYDGYNQRQVTRCGFLCLTPRWSPDNSKIAYTGYERGEVPRNMIQVYSLVLNRRIAFPAFPGTPTTPAWSPDGNEIAFSSSQSGDPEIYIAGSDGFRPRRSPTRAAWMFPPPSTAAPASRLLLSATAAARPRFI
jgi:TolB protein